MKHFLDVGSNVGQTFSDFLTRDSSFDGWEIHCFEPSPRHVPALMEKCAGLAARYRIHVHPYGLRGQSAIMPYWPKDDPRGDSFEHFLASDHVTTNLQPGYLLHAYAASAADWILSNTAAGDEVVLKLDVEGSEYDLLSHLIGRPDALARVRRILVEWHTIKSTSPAYSPELLGAMYSAVGLPFERWQF